MVFSMPTSTGFLLTKDWTTCLNTRAARDSLLHRINSPWTVPTTEQLNDVLFLKNLSFISSESLISRGYVHCLSSPVLTCRDGGDTGVWHELHLWTGAVWIRCDEGGGLSEESRDQYSHWSTETGRRRQFFTCEFCCVLSVYVLIFKIGSLGIFYNVFYNISYIIT